MRIRIHIFLFVLLWCHQDSNRGHTDFQSDALPTELWHQLCCFCFASAKVGLISLLTKLFCVFFPFGMKKMEKGVVEWLFSYELEEKLGIAVHDECVWELCFLEQRKGVAVVADARSVVGITSEDDVRIVFLA